MKSGPALAIQDHALWEARDVAAFLRVSLSWVYQQLEAGFLPYLRIGSLLRFEPDAIRRFARGELRKR